MTNQCKAYHLLSFYLAITAIFKYNRLYLILFYFEQYIAGRTIQNLTEFFYKAIPLLLFNLLTFPFDTPYFFSIFGTVSALLNAEPQFAFYLCDLLISNFAGFFITVLYNFINLTACDDCLVFYL